MKQIEKRFALLGVSTVLAATCQAQPQVGETKPVIVPAAVAVLHPTTGNAVEGTVYFVQMNGTVNVIADIKGLEPNSSHGFHIHEFGDCTAPDGTSAGDHYSPQAHKHGAPTDQDHHAGDLGNIQADAAGTARLETAVNFFSVAGPTNPIIGRAVIVHAKPDDLKSQPSGNAGDRLACGVIGIINPDYLLKQTNTAEIAGLDSAATNVPPNP